MFNTVWELPVFLQCSMLLSTIRKIILESKPGLNFYKLKFQRISLESFMKAGVSMLSQLKTFCLLWIQRIHLQIGLNQSQGGTLSLPYSHF